MDKEELRERYEATGDESFYQQARPLYERALEQSPDDPDLLRDFGYLHECHGRYALRAAAECYQRAISADSRHEKAHFQLISTLRALGDLEGAIPGYERRVRDDPADVSAYRLLASAYLGAADYDKAGATIGDGLEVRPDDPALTELRGEVFAATGRPDDALDCWSRAFTLAPPDYGISMRFSSAFLLEKLGRLAEAAGEWRYIIGWMEEDGDTIHPGWPRRELDRLEAELAAG